MNIEPKILLVDLNNFARYPTLPIGYLAAVVRKASMQVAVFAPLMIGIRGTTREVSPNIFSLLATKLNYLAATSRVTWIRRWRRQLANRRLSEITSRYGEVIDGFEARLSAEKPQAVLISTYLMYREVCARICAVCRDVGIPVLIGGPYFVQSEVISEWVDMPGLTALIAGEVELDLPSILVTLLKRGDLTKHFGIFVAKAGKPVGHIAAPLKELDAVPFPDYSDFPWDTYPNRIIPIITGRGCGWGVCSFCSDVTSSAGRSYRSRSPENVLDELAAQHIRHRATRFVFTDLKLNSNVDMWRLIIAGIRGAVPGSLWVGSVHVGMDVDNGLSEADLIGAAKSGCVRLTTGLESGSQRILNLMKKGATLDTTSRFLRSAASAGISCRCTMILGYPGETAEDIQASVDFLVRHSREIERVSLNRLQVVTGTTLHKSLKRTPRKFEGFSIVREVGAMAQVEHRDNGIGTVAHRRSVMRLLGEVHRINSRELSLAAREFEGVM